MGPMRLAPAGKDYLWGGTRLIEEYGKQLNLKPLAETWECSTHPDGPSVVMSGEYAGETLDAVIRRHPKLLGTKFRGQRELPILVKFIDAHRDLSVQVHPDDAYARAHEGQNGKTEFWYVLDAEEGAQIVYGFEHAMTMRQLKDAAQRGTFEKHLQKVPVKRGDTFYIPAGTVHAIGAGVLLVEVQENSNVTYRLYDYDRVDKDGHKRELHFEKAVEVLNMRPGSQARRFPRMVRFMRGCAREALCRCPYFEVERIQIKGKMDLLALTDTFQTLLCTEGLVHIRDSMSLNKGMCVFVPAGTGRLKMQGDGVLLRVQC